MDIDGNGHSDGKIMDIDGNDRCQLLLTSTQVEQRSVLRLRLLGEKRYRPAILGFASLGEHYLTCAIDFIICMSVRMHI